MHDMSIDCFVSFVFMTFFIWDSFWVIQFPNGRVLNFSNSQSEITSHLVTVTLKHFWAEDSPPCCLVMPLIPCQDRAKLKYSLFCFYPKTVDMLNSYFEILVCFHPSRSDHLKACSYCIMWTNLFLSQY